MFFLIVKVVKVGLFWYILPVELVGVLKRWQSQVSQKATDAEKSVFSGLIGVFYQFLWNKVIEKLNFCTTFVDKLLRETINNKQQDERTHYHNQHRVHDLDARRQQLRAGSMGSDV